MSMTVKNASPSKTMTATNFEKLADREAALRKLERIAEENLANTLRLLRHNRAHDVKMYRFSSKLIPLIGHKLVEGWDPFPRLEEAFRAIGDYVKQHQMRVSFHPDHFTVLSTPRSEVLQSSFEDLDRHVRMLESMGLDETAMCNIHIGGTYGNKEKSFARFLDNFSKLSERIRRRITLENDDKTFTAAETLQACQRVGVPMVLDIHHHMVNPGQETIDQLWPDIVKTWSNTLPPKIHASSPKSEKDPRGHADFVEVDNMLKFFQTAVSSCDRLDVMLEAKQKDEALFRLMEELKDKPGVRVLDQASIAFGKD